MNTALTLEHVLEIHDIQLAHFGGRAGVRDLGLIESAIAQPFATFGGVDLYPTLADKAAALGYFLISNHGFIDGNKRTGFAAMDTFLIGHEWKVLASYDEMEKTSLAVASHQLSRDEFATWVAEHLVPKNTPVVLQ